MSPVHAMHSALAAITSTGIDMHPEVMDTWSDETEDLGGWVRKARFSDNATALKLNELNLVL